MGRKMCVWRILVSVIFCYVFFTFCGSALDIKEFLPKEPLTKKRIVEEVLEYFQQDDPHGIPILKVPEPIELKGSFENTLMVLKDLSISGLSQLKLEYVDVNLEKLEAQIRLNLPRLEIIGDYEWPSSWFGSSEGDLNTTFINLDIGCILQIGIDEEGIIEVIDLKLIFDHERFIPTLTGLSLQHSAAVLAVDTFFGTIVLPVLQNSATSKGMPAINKILKEKLKDKFYPVDISPVDFMIAKMRSEIIRSKNLDPLKVDDKDVDLPLSGSLVLKNTMVKGLSSLHRSNVIRTEFVDMRMYVVIEIGTQALSVSTDWSLHCSLFPLGSGHADFTIDNFRVSVEVQQDADVRHPPIIRRINFELGNFSLRSPGERNIDYLLEAVVNIAPNVLRHQVLEKKIDEALKKIIQKRFNAINLEHIIHEQLEKMKEKK